MHAGMMMSRGVLGYLAAGLLLAALAVVSAGCVAELGARPARRHLGRGGVAVTPPPAAGYL